MIAGSRDAAADYYRTLTSLYRWYGATAHGWHYGVYDGDVNSHAASLDRGNEVLMDGVCSAPASVLDVGCGEGGFAVWAATRGYHVTGVTLCPEHVQLAASLATASGVAERCRFLVGDMDALPLADQSMDLVVNQETWCHSQSKAHYAKDVHRVLRPGGVFRCVDLALSASPRSAADERGYRTVREGFQVPSLISEVEACDCLGSAGFSDVSVVDLTAKVRRSAWLILAFSVGPHLLTAIRLDRLLYGNDDRIVGHYRRHVAACMAFNRGLRRGLFRYLLVTARKRR